ncbi:hypothetical protein IQ264_01115 [Phormidium sp. LEGE 05292]|uniref:hypothetical protein n=1 Tax=[Phormidium] sp. LEGE 05292 TaxID=767427 RepID=UPI00187E1776|nr:hypothetical protein [Phormidium sp. LEGE 05292]MBE9224072.1 hypothetical protein [Phormidium sp. LEGE 05292]
MKHIQKILQVSQYQLPVMLEKQAHKTPREQLVNYDELREYFDNTPFSVFFTTVLQVATPLFSKCFDG